MCIHRIIRRSPAKQPPFVRQRADSSRSSTSTMSPERQIKANQAVRPSVLPKPRQPSNPPCRVHVHVSYPYPMSYPFPGVISVFDVISMSHIDQRSFISNPQSMQCPVPPSDQFPTLQTQPICTNPVQTPISPHNTQPEKPLLSPRRPTANIPLLSPATPNLPKSPATFAITVAPPPPRRSRIGHGRHVPRAGPWRAREWWGV